MSFQVLKQIRHALRNLNPREVVEEAERDFVVGLLTHDESSFQRMVHFLLPPGTSERKARQAGRHILHVAREEDFGRSSFGLAEPSLLHPAHFYSLQYPDGKEAIEEFLHRNEDLWIPVARNFAPFRDAVVERLIRRVARENAVFAVAAALPNIVPSWLDLPWAVGEFASDTAFLTMNQIRLAFLIAAASDSPAGYMEQRGQIGSIVASAFGWRALARELVSKIPFGGGLLPKGLVAYAGTYVVGLSLERYQRLGRGLTAAEKKEQYDQALEHGRAVVESIVGRWKDRNYIHVA